MTENAQKPQSTPPPEATKREDPPAKKSGGGLGMAPWILIALGVAAAAAYASKPYWMPKAASYLQAEEPRKKTPAPDPQIEKALSGLESGLGRFDKDLKALAERMDALDKALEKTKAEIAALAQASSAASLDAAQTESRNIEGLKESLGERMDEAGGVLAGLQQRLDRLERAERRTSASPPIAPAVVLAVGQLRDAVARSGPFSQELDVLKALVGAESEMMAAVAALEPYAGEGVATLVSLRDRFGPLAGRVVGASRALKGDGWIERTANRLSSLVSIRKTGPRAAAAGEGADGVVARAESLLAGGDLAAAVQAMEGLSGASAEVAASWIGDAKARLAVERAVSVLDARAVFLLAPAKE